MLYAMEYTRTVVKTLSALYNVAMLDAHNKEEIIRVIEEEAERMQFGKLFVEFTVLKGRATNMQVETKRSTNLNRA